MSHPGTPLSAYTALGGRDAYALLGVPATADPAAIRQGYLRTMRRAHPDRHGGTDERDGGTDERDGGTDERDGGTDERDGDAGPAALVNLAWQLLSTDRDGYDRYRQALAVDPHLDPVTVVGASGTAGAGVAGEESARPDPWQETGNWHHATAGSADRAGATPPDTSSATPTGAAAAREWTAFEREAARLRRRARRAEGSAPSGGTGALARSPGAALLAGLVLLVVFAGVRALVADDAGTGVRTSSGAPFTQFTPLIPFSARPTAPFTLPYLGPSLPTSLLAYPSLPTRGLALLVGADVTVRAQGGTSGRADLRSDCARPAADATCPQSAEQPWLPDGTQVVVLCSRTGGYATGRSRSNLWYRVVTDRTTGWLHASLTVKAPAVSSC